MKCNKCKEEFEEEEKISGYYILTNRIYSVSMKKWVQTSIRFCSIKCIEEWCKE